MDQITLEGEAIQKKIKANGKPKMIQPLKESNKKWNDGLLEQLKSIADKLGHSPSRREVVDVAGYKFYGQLCDQFGGLVNAREKAKLPQVECPPYDFKGHITYKNGVLVVTIPMDSAQITNYSTRGFELTTVNKKNIRLSLHIRERKRGD